MTKNDKIINNKEIKMKFKQNDWVRHIHNNEIITLVEEIFPDYFSSTWSWCSSYNDFELWYPKPNEWVWIKKGTEEKHKYFALVQYKEDEEITYIEPYVQGIPPFFIKERGIK